MTQLEFFSRMRHVNNKLAQMPHDPPVVFSYYGYDQALSTYQPAPVDLCRELFLLEAQTWDIHDDLVRWSCAVLVDGVPNIIWGQRGLPTVVSPITPDSWPAGLGQYCVRNYIFSEIYTPT